MFCRFPEPSGRSARRTEARPALDQGLDGDDSQWEDSVSNLSERVQLHEQPQNSCQGDISFQFLFYHIFHTLIMTTFLYPSPAECPPQIEDPHVQLLREVFRPEAGSEAARGPHAPQKYQVRSNSLLFKIIVIFMHADPKYPRSLWNIT